MRLLILIGQLAGIAIPLIGCAFLVAREEGRHSKTLLLTSISCFLLNLTYTMAVHEPTVSGSIALLKLEYISNSMFYLSFCLFLCRYMNISQKKPIWAMFILWGILELICIASMSSESFGLKLYEDVSFEWSDELSIMLNYSTPGALYMIRYCFLSFLLCILLLYTTLKIFTLERGHIRNNFAKLAGAEFLISISLISMLTIDIQYDVVPVCASFAVLSIVLGIVRGDFFSVMDQSREWVLDHSDNLLVVSDARGGYLDANAMAKTVFDELGGLDAGSPLPGRIAAYISDEAGTGSFFEIKDRYYTLQTADIMEDDSRVGQSILFTDVTEPQKLLSELEAAKEKAEEANEAKSSFMSAMSHEIRTPMNAIVGMTEILLREQMTQQTREYLNTIKSAGDALLSIINDILDFSKIESGKMEIIEDDYKPMSLLNDLRMIFLNRIGEKPVELIYDISDELPSVLYGDEKRLRQIIINLANNAIKFTDEGSVRISMSLDMTGDGEGELHVAVTDTGQGIREEDIGKLFGSFSQVDTKRNKNKEGTGLGLSICKQLVELMGGTIGVESKYGEGSRFFFDIPQRVINATPAAELSEEEREREAAKNDVMSFTAPNARVLIVDDTPMNLTVAKGLLAPLGMKIETAENGREALGLIEGGQYDLVFMDHMMPVMDGIEAVAAIRAMPDERCRSLPVIALSANATAEAQKMFIEKGFDDFVAKPIQMKDICAILRKWLPPERVAETAADALAGISSDASSASGEEGNEPLPVIEGIDSEAGVANSGSKSLFMGLLGDYYKLIDRKAAVVTQYADEGLIREFTVEVHALKNTSRLIGALPLSEAFYELERLGDAGDLEGIRQKYPAILDEFKAMKPRLKPYAPQTGGGESVSAEELIAELTRLRDAMEQFDLDGADAAIKKLTGYAVADNMVEDIEELDALVADVAIERVTELSDRLIAELKGEG